MYDQIFLLDCKLNQEAQIDMSISKKRKSQAKKITGFQVINLLACCFA